MACFGDKVTHVIDNFLPEDVQEYLERLEEIHWDNGNSCHYTPLTKLDSVEELILFCEEAFECRVTDTWCRKFQKGSKSRTFHQARNQDTIIYLFGGGRDICLEELNTDPEIFSLQSGDILYLPSRTTPLIYSITEGEEDEKSIVIIFDITKPYNFSESNNFSTSNFSGPRASNFSTSNFSGPRTSNFSTSNFSGTSGMSPTWARDFERSMSSFSSGGNTSTIIDADSEYGRNIIKQISDSLALQGISLGWDDD